MQQVRRSAWLVGARVHVEDVAVCDNLSVHGDSDDRVVNDSIVLTHNTAKAASLVGLSIVARSEPYRSSPVSATQSFRRPQTAITTRLASFEPRRA
jgi:hypothetical protein